MTPPPPLPPHPHPPLLLTAAVAVAVAAVVHRHYLQRRQVAPMELVNEESNRRR